MIDRLKTLPQYCLPQKAISSAFGWLASVRKPLWFKHWCINHFIKKYKVDMSEAIGGSAEKYSDFNAFFTRLLKPSLRPIGKNIISPVDGEISERSLF
jgi:phosphatidylserine decarboxylase